MTVIGITGPSGAGKGEVSGILLEKYGFTVIDADKVYHSLVSAPSKCLEEIKDAFGGDVISHDGSLNRSALSKLVFGEKNRERLLLLNSITHKYVASEIKDTVSTLKKAEKNCVIDAPLLIEAGLTDICDITLAVLADEDIRAERISARDKISHADALLRISSQKNAEFYIAHSDAVISNNGDKHMLDTALSKILSERRVIV